MICLVALDFIRITSSRFDYVSRGRPPAHCISRGNQITPTSPELSKSHNLFRNKFTQPLTSPEFPESDQASPEGQNQTISTSPEEHNQTISTSPEYQNQTIFTSPEVTKPNFWLKGIITPDPPSQEPKLICISPGRGLMLSRGKGVWGARPVAG